ncbi:MAG: hypothetical protein WDA16_04190 [Candidatus Thermoplasmatota archaeon]
MSTDRVTIALIALTLVPMALANVPRQETQAYTTGEGETTLPNDLWPPAHPIGGLPITLPPSPSPACPPMNLGGACFTLEGSEHQAAITLHDAIAKHVAADAQARDANGTVLASKAFCATTTLSIPTGSIALRVLLYNAAIGSIVCEPGLIEPTTGTITATYR